jgi:hypothetical protein
MMMTPMLLFALLAALLAVLIWQIRSLLRGRSTRRPTSQDTRPLALQKSARAPAEDTSKLSHKRERKRDLSAINASLDGLSVTRRLDKLSLYSDVESKLAQGFELYEEGAISIDGYEAIVRIEGKVVHRKRSELKAREMSDSFSPAELDEFRQDVEAAEIAIQWCLDWAADRRNSALQIQPDSNQT